jgi:endonuclease III
LEHEWFKKAMEAVNKFFKEERDPLFHRGEARGKVEGEVKKSYDVVENLLIKLGLSDEKAAEIAEVSIDFVQKVRADLAKKKKN